MRFTRIDWSSDTTVLLILVFVVCLIVAVALERVSPKKKRKGARRIDAPTGGRRGDIID